MKLIITSNKKEAVKKAVSIISELIKKKPNAVLGLATGKTMIPLYKKLVKLYKNKKIDFSKIRTFNLDEYAGLKPTDKESYHYYMNKYFFNKININKSNTHFPSSNGKKYEQEIKKVKGIDLCLLGIGQNAHIAFNEPGSSFRSTTRKIKLTKQTRKINSKFFLSAKEVPRYAYTMGIKTIMNSKKIILLAFGKKKSDAITNSIKAKITEEVPASILRKHKDAIFIIDKKSSKGL